MLVLLLPFAFFFPAYADQVIYQPSSSAGKDMWLSSYYNNTAVDDDMLQVGGWGDWYRTFIKFDLTGLPQTATQATMFLFVADTGGTSTPVSMKPYLLTSTWNEQTQDYYDTVTGYSMGTVPAPTPNSWYGLNIASIYNGWKNGTYANNGFVFLATGNNNQFNYFRSSDYSDAKYRPKLVVTYSGLNLSFPLECSTPSCSGSNNLVYTSGPYTSQGINSVVDHEMDYVYVKDGEIVSFTGEMFNETSSYLRSFVSPCYPKVGNTPWSYLLTSMYKGTNLPGPGGNCSNGVALNYDSHPGYDYRASYGTPVRAAASGTVVNFGGQRCVPKVGSCSGLGAIGITHGDGYITQYLHLSTISVSAGDSVSRGQVIGYSGDTGIPNVPHLHFEVLKQVSGSSGTQVSHYKVVDPYGWLGTGTDPLEAVTGIKNVCLWQTCTW